jgi:hypothetical protein
MTDSTMTCLERVYSLRVFSCKGIGNLGWATNFCTGNTLFISPNMTSTVAESDDDYDITHCLHGKPYEPNCGGFYP